MSENIIVARDGGITVSLPIDHAEAIAEERDVSDLACNAFRVALGKVDPIPPEYRVRTLTHVEELGK